jgi:hypothetical protein
MDVNIDTPERAQAIELSADVAAVRHLCRAYDVTMKRRQIKGRVLYDIGRAGTTKTAVKAHGWIVFDDWGKLADVALFGQHQGQVALIDLEALMEYGPGATAEHPLLEEDTTLVLEALPMIIAEPLTGAIPLPGTNATLNITLPSAVGADLPGEQVAPLLGDVGVLQTPEAVLRPPTDAVSGPVTASIPIVGVGVLPLPEGPARPLTLREAQERTLAKTSSAASTWGPFLIGLAMIVIAFGGVLLYLVNRSAIVAAMSVVLGIIGIGFTVTAIHTNDRRLRELRLVGLHR